jgi:hypothetical protein
MALRLYMLTDAVVGVVSRKEGWSFSFLIVLYSINEPTVWAKWWS